MAVRASINDIIPALPDERTGNCLSPSTSRDLLEHTWLCHSPLYHRFIIKSFFYLLLNSRIFAFWLMTYESSKFSSFFIKPTRVCQFFVISRTNTKNTSSAFIYLHVHWIWDKKNLIQKNDELAKKQISPICIINIFIILQISFPSKTEIVDYKIRTRIQNKKNCKYVFITADIISATSALQQQAADIRNQRINWQSYQQ